MRSRELAQMELVDDILILAPIPSLVTEALPYLARNGVLNVFAGFPEREKSELPINFEFKNVPLP